MYLVHFQSRGGGDAIDPLILKGGFRGLSDKQYTY